MKRIDSFWVIMSVSVGSLLFTGCNGIGNSGNNSFTLSAVETPMSNDSIESFVDNLYRKMSMDERLAQLQCMYLLTFFNENNELDTTKCKELIPYGIGHIPQFAGNSTESPEVLRDKVEALQQWLVKNTPNGIPAIFHEEVLTGLCAKGATIYPQQIGQACSFNTELAEVKTRQTAAIARKIGATLALSPMVDVVRNPYFNRLEESYGEDAYLSAALGTAFVKGLQYGGLDNSVAVCSKHFLGYGGGSDTYEKELYEEILLPHETMIRTQGSKVVMMGYHKVSDKYATVNDWLMQDILREYLKFDGVIVTDYGAMNETNIHKDPMQRAIMAINAGIDVEFPTKGNFENLPEAIKKGLVSETVFESSVKRVLRLKVALGLFDKNKAFCDKNDIIYDMPQERKTAYDIATQSVVLLKNEGILPINGAKKIALVGPNANTLWAMLGDYTYPSMNMFWRDIYPDENDTRIVTLLDGLKNKAPEGCEIEYSCGCDWTEVAPGGEFEGGDERARWLDRNRRIKRNDNIDKSEALKLASGSDLIIAAVGENSLLCGENRDRGSLRLPGEQEQFVRELLGTGKPLVLIMFGGRAQVIGDLADKCAAIIQAWYPGEEGGNALADIIYGNVNPSGKLCVGYPKVEINENICYNNDVKMDTRLQWPFGYGLSYTTYEYSDLKVDKTVSTSDKSIEISFNISNTGKMAGEEIVQLYLSPADKSIPIKPIKLVGFGRVTLKCGESKRVKFRMSPQQLGYYENGKWNIQPGNYLIKLGASSTDIKEEAILELKGEKVVLALRNVYFSEITKVE